MRKQKAETPVVARALEAVRVQFPGGFWWRANSGGNKSGHRCNSENLPDICGVQRFGVSAFVEVKTREGRLSKEQLQFLKDMDSRGALIRVYIQDAFYTLDRVPDRNMPRMSE